MNVNVSNGLGLIGIGMGEMGSYFKFNRPAALIWPDCHGSIAEYVAVMPVDAEQRQLLQQKINSSLYENFTGKEKELYEILQPLFSLFENGEYRLAFTDGTAVRERIEYSGGTPKTFEMKWYMQCARTVNRADSNLLVKAFKKHVKENALQKYHFSILDYTTTNVYEWGNDMYVATRPQEEFDAGRITYFEEKITAGERPFAFILCGEYNLGDMYSANFVLDGHHKLAAYSNLGIPPPLVFITRIFNSSDEIEYDIEALAGVLYPWQTEHIVNNWDENRDAIIGLMQNPDTNLKSVVKHGFTEEFYDNGNLKLRGTYNYGQPDGTITEWYESGRPKFDKGYKGGKFYGSQKEWFANGQISTKGAYNQNNMLHGKWLSYFEDGTIKSKMHFNNGKYGEGYSYSRYNHTGNMEWERWVKNGVVINEKRYNDLGGLMSEKNPGSPQIVASYPWLRISLVLFAFLIVGIILFIVRLTMQ